MKLILLPGLDGTGTLFRQFISALPSNWAVSVICYPATGAQSYPTLLNHVRPQLPLTEPFFLLAESFSGPLAYQIAIDPPQNLQAVIFVATFLTNPCPFLLRWRRWVPLRWKLPNWFMHRFLLGANADQRLLADFWSAVAINANSTLQNRLTAIATLPEAYLSVEIPCIYLQAQSDWLVPNDSVNVFRQCCKQLKIYQVAGTHFLLQSSPAECAEIIKGEMLR